LNRQLTTTTNSARTVDADVRAVNDIADGIRGTAGSIGDTAGSINANAAAILTEARGIEDSTAAIRDIAGGINTLAASILQVSGNINDDVQQINRNLDATIELARQIHANTARLVAAGVITRSQAACIDEEVHLLTPAHNGGAACGHDKEAADER
jgi:methyl-accepting chemotaxis protein